MTDKLKPSNLEEDFFAREDAEKMRKLAAEQKKALAAEERKRLKELHWMRCPRCGMEMKPMKVRDIEAEACFSCGGVFLAKDDIDIIAHPKQKGIMSAILNWFSEETKPPVK